MPGQQSASEAGSEARDWVYIFWDLDFFWTTQLWPWCSCWQTSSLISCMIKALTRRMEWFGRKTSSLLSISRTQASVSGNQLFDPMITKTSLPKPLELTRVSTATNLCTQPLAVTNTPSTQKQDRSPSPCQSSGTSLPLKKLDQPLPGDATCSQRGATRHQISRFNDEDPFLCLLHQGGPGWRIKPQGQF